MVNGWRTNEELNKCILEARVLLKSHSFHFLSLCALSKKVLEFLMWLKEIKKEKL